MIIFNWYNCVCTWNHIFNIKYLLSLCLYIENQLLNYKITLILGN